MNKANDRMSNYYAELPQFSIPKEASSSEPSYAVRYMGLGSISPTELENVQIWSSHLATVVSSDSNTFGAVSIYIMYSWAKIL